MVDECTETRELLASTDLLANSSGYLNMSSAKRFAKGPFVTGIDPNQLRQDINLKQFKKAHQVIETVLGRLLDNCGLDKRKISVQLPKKTGP